MFQLIHASDESGQNVPVDWPRITWVFVFQLPIFGLIILALTDITEATNTFCSGSLSPKHGNFYATVLTTLSLGAAVAGLWKFYQRVKQRVKSRRGLSKVLCFKAMVFLRWAQSVTSSHLSPFHNKLIFLKASLRHPSRPRSPQTQPHILLRRPALRPPQHNILRRNGGLRRFILVHLRPAGISSSAPGSTTCQA
jgi:hypothetical protein